MKRAWGFGIVFVAVLSGCIGDTTDPDGYVELGEARQALASCIAPMNAHADWIDLSRTGSHWCVACTYVSIEIRNSSTNAVLLNWWAGIDNVNMQYMPLGFCGGDPSCIAGYWYRTGISGDWYGPISVSLGGTVNFPSAGTTISITPQTCGADANGKTTITGIGSDGVYYSVHLTNTWFN